jgi:hypothetical protein
MRTVRRGKPRRRTYKGGSNKALFPKKDGVDYESLKLSVVGKYSLTRRDDSKTILRLMKQTGDLSKKHITDLNGGIGGDTIAFGLVFKKVDSIEMNDETFELLEHNVKLYDLPNVTLHHGDSTKIYNWKTDILYMDPPWGGPDYKLKTKLDLFLGDLDIADYLEEIFQRPTKPKHVFIKVPFNYNFEALERFEHVKKHNVGKFCLVHIRS